MDMYTSLCWSQHLLFILKWIVPIYFLSQLHQRLTYHIFSSPSNQVSTPSS
jgi:hypothetical protein